MLNIVFFLENHLFQWKNVISKQVQSTIFHEENLVCDIKSCFFVGKPFFHWENGISNFFIYRKTDFYTVKILFLVLSTIFHEKKIRKIFHENLVFVVKSCIFLKIPSFPLAKLDFRFSFKYLFAFLIFFLQKN